MPPQSAPQRVFVRAIEEPDWPAVVAIVRAIVADGRTYAYPEDLDAAGARAIWTEPPPGRTVVATIDGAVVGTAKMGPNRPGRGGHVATASVMVAPDRERAGVGRTLGESVIAWATDEGYRGIQFNAVVAANVRAVALWRSLGFEVVGSVPGAYRHREEGFVDLLVLYREIS